MGDIRQALDECAVAVAELDVTKCGRLTGFKINGRTIGGWRIYSKAPNGHERRTAAKETIKQHQQPLAEFAETKGMDSSPLFGLDFTEAWPDGSNEESVVASLRMLIGRLRVIAQCETSDGDQAASPARPRSGDADIGTVDQLTPAPLNAVACFEHACQITSNNRLSHEKAWEVLEQHGAPPHCTMPKSLAAFTKALSRANQPRKPAADKGTNGKSIIRQDQREAPKKAPKSNRPNISIDDLRQLVSDLAGGSATETATAAKSLRTSLPRFGMQNGEIEGFINDPARLLLQLNKLERAEKDN